LTRSLKMSLEQEGLQVQEYKAAACPYVPTLGQFEELFSKNKRYDHRRALNRLEKESLTLSIERHDNLDEVLLC
jgi:hypothetical protein